MPPLLRPDVATSGALGRCSTHRRPLLPEPQATVAEQIDTDRLAAESRAYLDGDESAPPLPRAPRRRGHCPACVQAVAAAAVAYLEGNQ